MTNPPAEDLREHYITPLYLSTMAVRARDWTEEFIKEQIAEFKRTIPEYPEVFEVLEAELYSRRLNVVHAEVRRAPSAALPALLAKHKGDADIAEIISTEIELRRLREGRGSASR